MLYKSAYNYIPIDLDVNFPFKHIQRKKGKNSILSILFMLYAFIKKKSHTPW